MPDSERGRVREPEPEQETTYDDTASVYHELRARANNSHVVKEADRSWEQNAQGRIKWYSAPRFDTVLPEILVFKHEMADQSGRHTHQGGLALWCLYGEGTTYVDGEYVDWEGGDLIFLPPKPGGVSHQHFNRNDPDEPCAWLAIIPQRVKKRYGGRFQQDQISPDWETTHSNAWNAEGDHDHDHDHDHPSGADLFEDFDYADWHDYEPPAETETLYDDLVVRRNSFRQELAQSQVDGTWTKLTPDDVEWEWNPQGKMKWYLHPAYDNRPVHLFLYSLQEIPAGSRSGRQHRQGGLVHFILEGTGHSVIDGRRWDWEAGDLVGLPMSPDGMGIQHFNDDSENPVRMIRAEPFEHEALGYDLGCGFAQLEACPEYDGWEPDA